MIEKFTVARDDSLYHAWPDVALTAGGKLVCVFSECTHHGDRSYTRIMLTDSADRGRTWTPKRPLSPPLRYTETARVHWNCARITCLSDGRLVVVCDRISGKDEGNEGGTQEIFLWFSQDEGATWSAPRATPVTGIVPDKVIELKAGPYRGRWVLAAHTVLHLSKEPLWQVRCWTSDDRGESWQGPHIVAAAAGLKLCEGSVLELPSGQIACFMRENSFIGRDAYKSVSLDGGTTWQGPVEFPLPGCHRPVAGLLASGRVMITHRFLQGGKGWLGWWTQNFFAALTDVESCLGSQRAGARCRILPIDFDRSAASDTGYSGWVQFDDGEIYIVNYIVDDAPKAQIRGYSIRESEFMLGL